MLILIMFFFFFFIKLIVKQIIRQVSCSGCWTRNLAVGQHLPRSQWFRVMETPTPCRIKLTLGYVRGLRLACGSHVGIAILISRRAVGEGVGGEGSEC